MLSRIDLGLREQLRDPERRHEFFTALTQDDIAAQIRELRKKRSLTQLAFAQECGMKQSAVSRIERAEYSPTTTTMFRAARALDARWVMLLEPCEEAVKRYEALDTDYAEKVDAAANVEITRPSAGENVRIAGAQNGNAIHFTQPQVIQ
jgi:transcriptional regulator with XRE-family HTH domain